MNINSTGILDIKRDVRETTVERMAKVHIVMVNV
jgi:hypothetical protein